MVIQMSVTSLGQLTPLSRLMSSDPVIAGGAVILLLGVLTVSDGVGAGVSMGAAVARPAGVQARGYLAEQKAVKVCWQEAGTAETA
jgi:hypothetical protein